MNLAETVVYYYDNNEHERVRLSPMRSRLDEARSDPTCSMSELQTNQVGHGRKQRRAVDTKSAFLAAFRVCASITEAAKAAGLDRALHYRWLADDPTYPTQFEAARLSAAATVHAGAVADAAAYVHLIAGGGRGRRTKRKSSALKKLNYAARKRDGFKCRICEFSICLNVHHIVARSEQGRDEIDNLITLCPNHHAMAHAGLLTKDDLAKLVDGGSADLQGIRIESRIHLVDARVKANPFISRRCQCGLYGSRYAQQIRHVCAS
jgi:hypothetical protein